MQSSQIVPGSSAHEALATLTRFRSRPFWGSFCMCKAHTGLYCTALRSRTTIGFRSCLPRQTLMIAIADTITHSDTRTNEVSRSPTSHHTCVGTGNSDIHAAFVTGIGAFEAALEPQVSILMTTSEGQVHVKSSYSKGLDVLPSPVLPVFEAHSARSL